MLLLLSFLLFGMYELTIFSIMFGSFKSIFKFLIFNFLSFNSIFVSILASGLLYSSATFALDRLSFSIFNFALLIEIFKSLDEISLYLNGLKFKFALFTSTTFGIKGFDKLLSLELFSSN